jgi:hypothetical protein
MEPLTTTWWLGGQPFQLETMPSHGCACPEGWLSRASPGQAHVPGEASGAWSGFQVPCQSTIAFMAPDSRARPGKKRFQRDRTCAARGAVSCLSLEQASRGPGPACCVGICTKQRCHFMPRIFSILSVYVSELGQMGRSGGYRLDTTPTTFGNTSHGCGYLVEFRTFPAGLSLDLQPTL